MKTVFILNEIISSQEVSCDKNINTTIHSGFKYYEFSCESTIEELCVNKNIILFFLKGHFKISCNQYTDHLFSEHEMILLPKSSAIKIYGEQGNQLIFMLFDVPEESHDKYEIQQLAEIKQTSSYNFEAIPVRYPLTSFIELVAYCLQGEMRLNTSLHILKHREFFLLLKFFYSRDEIITLFHPIIGKNIDFRDFIMQNYLKVNNVENLIALSNMGRSSFYSKFKETFGVTAKQWMQKQIGERIIGKAAEPGMRVKQLMETCSFESHAHIYRYFKQHFGCTPKEFINRYQGKEEYC